jgi:hypothetical protein
MYDAQEEVLPACELNDSDDSDDYENNDEWDGLKAKNSVSLADEAEDHLLPPYFSRCSVALSGMPTREAYLSAMAHRICLLRSKMTRQT